MDVEKKLLNLGIELPTAPQKGGVYTPCMLFAKNLYYISGCGPNIGSQTFTGKLGDRYSIEEGQTAAHNSMLNVLSVLKAEIGDLSKVRPIKILVFVACSDDFYSQPMVANGASELLVELFETPPSRSAIGVNVLPGNIPVEIEAIFEVVDIPENIV